MKIKNAVSLIIAITIMFSLVGCTSDKAEIAETSQVTTTEMAETEQTSETEGLTEASQDNDNSDTVIIGGKEYSVDTTEFIYEIYDDTSNDITGISKLKNIKKLYIYPGFRKDKNINPFKGLIEISSLENIEECSISGCMTEDFDFLKNLSKIKSLSISNCLVTFGIEHYHTELDNIDFVENMPLLDYISIDGTNVADISKLSNCKNLKTISFCESRIQDVSCISELHELEHIEFTDCKVSDISCVSELSNLKSIKFSSCNVLDISFIANIKELLSINFSDSKVTDISVLKNKKYEYVNLSENSIIDLSALNTMSDMEDIILNDMYECDFNTITNINASTVYLNNNEIDDISFITGINAPEVFLENNNITDLSPLLEENNLYKVWIYDNPAAKPIFDSEPFRDNGISVIIAEHTND